MDPSLISLLIIISCAYRSDGIDVPSGCRVNHSLQLALGLLLLSRARLGTRATLRAVGAHPEAIMPQELVISAGGSDVIPKSSAEAGSFVSHRYIMPYNLQTKRASRRLAVCRKLCQRLKVC